MSYAEITFKDKNPVKRWLQKKRLTSALKYVGQIQQQAMFCDFGAGNGELCKLLSTNFPHAKIVCYEPTSELLVEARKNLRHLQQVSFYQKVEEIHLEQFDLVFCLEVFEHLPPNETADALTNIYNLLKPNGGLVVGVPNEIGIPALYKGLFRMTRRYGAYDAGIKNIVLSFLGFPPKDRPLGEIQSGIKFYHAHTGFDFRTLKAQLHKNFILNKMYVSPWEILGLWLMPEVYFYLNKVSLDTHRISNDLKQSGNV